MGEPDMPEDEDDPKPTGKPSQAEGDVDDTSSPFDKPQDPTEPGGD